MIIAGLAALASAIGTIVAWAIVAINKGEKHDDEGGRHG